MKKCLNCGKPIEQAEGKRERLYCNGTCRAAFFQKKNKGVKRFVKVETYEKALEELKATIAENNELKNKLRILAEREGGGNQKAIHPLAIPESESISKVHLKIEEYEKELAGLGAGQIANQRRKYLQTQIKNLKPFM